MDIHLECGMLLSKACDHHSLGYAIVTNDKSVVDERLAALGGAVTTIQHEFDRNVPEGMAFYAAHFKLDLLRGFGSGDYGAKIGLIDIDSVLLRPIALPIPNDNTFLVYDISEDARSELGDSVILNDLNLIGGPTASKACWYGGEFIAGSAPAFARLSRTVDPLWPAYSAHWRELHHVGDEMIITAALERLRSEGVVLVDAGQAGIVARWWTARTGYVQRSFDEVKSACILHLPSDKRFLAERAKAPFNPDRMIVDYRSFAAGKLGRRRVANTLLNLFRAERKYVGRVSKSASSARSDN
jgi:hypothetical protein